MSRLVKIFRGGSKDVEEIDLDDNESKEEQEEDAPVPENQRCWVCKKRKITYQPIDCDCAVYCTKCAMKLCTAFRCKGCKQMSSGMRRVRARR